MPRGDWLIGHDRTKVATERIYGAAAELIAHHGYDAFTIEALATKIHCSPATTYRYAGGKAAIRDAVTLRLSSRIVNTVRKAIDGLTGPERIMTAVAVALERMRSRMLCCSVPEDFFACEADIEVFPRAVRSTTGMCAKAPRQTMPMATPRQLVHGVAPPPLADRRRPRNSSQRLLRATSIHRAVIPQPQRVIFCGFLRRNDARRSRRSI